MKNNVLELPTREISPQDKQMMFNYFVLCCTCTYKWFTRGTAKLEPFSIKCPKCQEEDSFPTIVPQVWIEERSK